MHDPHIDGRFSLSLVSQSPLLSFFRTSLIGSRYCDHYYIETVQALLGIASRILKLSDTIENEHRPVADDVQFYCPRFRSEWCQMDVLDNLGPEGVLCHRCGFTLERREDDAQKYRRLRSQIDPLMTSLSSIDPRRIPRFDVASALERKSLLEPDQATCLSQPDDPTAGGIRRELFAEVNESNARTGIDLAVSLYADEEAPRRKEVKTAQERDNSLPIWHRESKIIETSSTLQQQGGTGNNFMAVKPREDTSDGVKMEHAPMTDECYAQFRSDGGSYVKPLSRTNLGEEDEDEDEDHQFEDVL